MKKRKIIHKKRSGGLFNPDAPFWRGERAEHLVKERLSQRKRPSKRRKKK